MPAYRASTFPGCAHKARVLGNDRLKAKIEAKTGR